jgi:hypothetical protein
VGNKGCAQDLAHENSSLGCQVKETTPFSGG